MLRWRLLVGFSLVAMVIGLCWLDHRAETHGAAVPGIWLLPLAVALVVLASGELLGLLERAGLRPVAWAVYIGNLLLVLVNWVPLAAGALGKRVPLEGPLSPGEGPPPSGSWALAALVLGATLVCLAEIVRYEKPGRAAAHMAAGVFALVYIGLMISFAVQLRMTWGVTALASLVLVVKLGDTGAYVVGRLLGRHKLAPTLSPGKTVEGAIGGLAFCCLGAFLAAYWIVPMTAGAHFTPAPWWGWLLFGLLVGGAGMLGDLAESLLKRDAGQKDSSGWLPGLGGVLDILDSILWAAPVAWYGWTAGFMGG